MPARKHLGDADDQPTVVLPGRPKRLPSVPPLSEKQWQQQVLDFARYTGWLCYHTHDSRHSERGFPDICAVRGNRMLMIELKSQRGRLSLYQVGWLEALKHVPSVEVFVWRPSDWPQVQDVLLHLGTQPQGDPMIYPMREAAS